MRLLILLFIPALALASPDNPTRHELLQTVAHIQKLAEETQAELEQEKLAHKGTQDALVMADSALDDTQKQFNTYRTAAEQEIAKGNKAILERDHLLKKLHLAKWILCGLWVLAVGLVITKIPLPFKAYGLYAGAALVAAGCSFIWFSL